MSQPECLNLPVKKIIEHGQDQFFSLYLEKFAAPCRTGQFVMIRPESWNTEPLWARPFSICENADSGLRIFFQIAGRGTRLLSTSGIGERIKIWGPLGNGFDISGEENLLILAGGMGIAPFTGLIKNHADPERVSLVFGHTAELDCFPIHELPKTARVTTFKQETEKDLKTFQDLIQARVKSSSGQKILACGPLPFLRFVHRTCRENAQQAWVSLENRMACGVGACLGCVQEDKNGEYVTTCKHGPVFSVNDIRI
ncbi:MAG: dihydroorotate dehydrogenase electron transfer subunit [Thermodesulfobacteriota bacterium]